MEKRDFWGTVNLNLPEGDISAIEQAIPKGASVGNRYLAQQMANLDSEQG